DQSTNYKIDDQSSLLQNLLQLFITQFNTTTNSKQIFNSLLNYFEVNQIDPSLIFNELAYQDYNFSMIGYFHEYGVGTEIDYQKAFWMYKLSSESEVKNDFENNLDNLSLLDKFNINNYIIGKISLGLLYFVGK
ncbi:5597_t:CDS:1, partial [Racocetra fulgida]